MSMHMTNKHGAWYANKKTEKGVAKEYWPWNTKQGTKILPSKNILEEQQSNMYALIINNIEKEEKLQELLKTTTCSK